jgi:hypothetical protein
MNDNTSHQFYCGVDLHARNMYVHALDHKGKTHFDEDIPADPMRVSMPSSPFARTSSSAASACSPGTGSPTFVKTNTGRSRQESSCPF